MTFSRHYLAQRATLDAVDLAEVQGCRRAHNQLGFAYQVGFVRLLNRCLTLIVACIIYWQAKDISRVIDAEVVFACVLEDGEALAAHVLLRGRDPQIGNGFHDLAMEYGFWYFI